MAWLNDEFAEMDPNGLALDAFVLDESGLRYEALTPRPRQRLTGRLGQPPTVTSALCDAVTPDVLVAVSVIV